MRLKPFVLFAATCFGHLAAADDPWVLLRDHDGTCSVQRPTERPLLGTEIGRAASRTAACQDLLNRYESASTEPSKCGNFTENVRRFCERAGVRLPDPNR